MSPPLRLRQLPADLETPVSAYWKLRQPGRPGFLLESVAGGEQLARYSFLGTGPARRLVAEAGRLRIEDLRRGGARDGGPLIEGLRRELVATEISAPSGTPPFRGGAVGFFAYDFVRCLERLPERAAAALDVPAVELFDFDEVIAFDHARQSLILMVAGDDADSRLDALESRLGMPLPAAAQAGAARLTSAAAVTLDEDAYASAVLRAQAHIAAGDIFQVVLSRRWSADFAGDAFEVYRRLRRIDPSPYMVFLESGARSLVAASPEMLVRVTGDRIETHPIAGTRPRSGDEVEDARREAELRLDPKENAEHVMLVDLGRNDLGRMARPGSVRVKSFRQVERYARVMHLVSKVDARLRSDVGAFDAFAAAFPAGTVSGAPKVRAMEIIEELEPERRGTYAGAVTYVDRAGNLDSCITIRSIFFAAGRAHWQAGAGIVEGSVPASEVEETVAKSRALRAALGGEA